MAEKDKTVQVVKPLSDDVIRKMIASGKSIPSNSSVSQS